MVSVILDNYNYEKYIEKAIESVLLQTYTDFELIIVDDGSTDNSSMIIEKCAKKDSRIKVILKENGGQTSAFNAAFAVSKGSIIAFLDSDDFWYPEKLEKIVQKHKRYRFVQHYLSKNGNGIYRKTNAKINWHDVLVQYGYLFNHSVCSSLSFDRELLTPFFPLSDEREMIYCTDGVLLMIALSLTEIGILEEELGFYRIHGSNGFVGKTDYGEKARSILEKQKKYVNKQLRMHGFPEIQFDNHKYFSTLISELLSENKLKKNDKIVIYGTESSGIYMTEVFLDMHFEIWGYADSSKEKQGNSFLNKRIWAPYELNDYRQEFDKILIASSAQDEIALTLEELNFHEGKDYYKLPL